ncbi:uncharacterized protein LOC116947811 isoform X1 [Petromyzon marinus]|uniref:uncharacterized protein LOC116947811 isoform X1 n=1 Tax=Petromyzon marinus TaxID=7757 RepID=UPI003F6E4EB9
METVSPRDKKGPTLPAAVGLPTTRSSKRDLWLTSRRGWQATAVDLQAPPTTGSNATKVYLGHQSDSLNAHCTPRVSRVSELLCKRSEDPEEVLYNLGFGKDEPDVTTKIPARYFSSVSQARGINGQVLLASQLARLSGEHSGLERRFRQVRMLANVADTLNQIYSQVSGVHVPMLLPLVRTRSLFVQQEEGGREEDQCTSVGNIQRSGKTKVARRLIKTLSKHKLFGGTVNTIDYNCLMLVKQQLTVPTAEPGKTSLQRPAIATAGGHLTRESMLAEPSLKTVHFQFGEAFIAAGLTNTCLKVVEEKYSCTCRDCREPDSGREVTFPKSGISKLTSCVGTAGEESRACGEHRDEPSDIIGCFQTKLNEAETPMSRQSCIPRPSAVVHRDKGSSTTHHGPQDKPRLKDSFDLEEVLNNDGETYRAGLHSAGAREFWGLPARTGSAHSDSSGYAEDPAVFDCSSAVHHQQSTDFLIGADSQTSQGIPFAPSCISEQLPCGSLLPPCDMRSWPHLGEAVPLADKYHRDGERIELKAHPAKSFYEQPRGLHFSAFEDFIGGSQTLKRTQNGSSDSLGNSLIYKVPQRNLFSSRTPNRQCTACQTEHVPSENDSVIADDECVATAPGDAQHHSLRERNKQRSVSTQTDSVDTSSTIRDAVPTACTFSHLPLRSHTMIVMGDHEKSCEFAVSSRGGMPETQDGTSGHQKFAYTSNNRVRLACVCAHHCECHLHLQRQCHHRMYPECIDCHKSCEPRVLFRSRSLDDLIMSRRGLHYSLIVQV